VLGDLRRVEDERWQRLAEGGASGLSSLRATVRELQQAVVLLAEELDRRDHHPA
jgi:hypothetical protein